MPSPSTLALDRTHIRPGDRICAAVSGGADSVALLLALHAANHATQRARCRSVCRPRPSRPARRRGRRRPAFVENLCLASTFPSISTTLASPTALPDRRNPRRGRPRRALRLLRLSHRLRPRRLRPHRPHSRRPGRDRPDEASPRSLDRRPQRHPSHHQGPSPSQPRPGQILRPLLPIRRAELEDYLSHLNQPWRTDSSNSDAAFTRNRIRHHLLPLLRADNPSLDQTLANLAELAREEESRWQSELTRLLPQLLLPGKPVRGGGRAVSTAPGESSVAIEIERLAPSIPPSAAASSAPLPASRRPPQLRRNRPPARLRRLPVHPTVVSKPGATLQLSNGLLAERSPRELRLSAPHCTLEFAR